MLADLLKWKFQPAIELGSKKWYGMRLCEYSKSDGTNERESKKYDIDVLEIVKHLLSQMMICTYRRYIKGYRIKFLFTLSLTRF